MTHKGLLLSAVGLLAWSAATAAEPVASPARSAGACGRAGGGLLLPGSDICVRLGGAVRTEAAARSTTSTATSALTGGSVATFPASPRASRLRALGRVDLDARTETAAGPFRAFVSVKTP